MSHTLSVHNWLFVCWGGGCTAEKCLPDVDVLDLTDTPEPLQLLINVGEMLGAMGRHSFVHRVHDGTKAASCGHRKPNILALNVL